MSTRSAASGQPTRASDVMAFGQETGRVLADGRVVGRAEPFAKVFQSSRLVKQSVGLTAWGILEDIALDATLRRYETARYVLDPSACIERFTTTPRTRQTPRSAPCTENPVAVGSVSGKPVHGGTGHGKSVQQEQEDVVVEEEQHQPTPDRGAELRELGVDAAAAAALSARYSPTRIREVARAAARRASRNRPVGRSGP